MRLRTFAARGEPLEERHLLAVFPAPLLPKLPAGSLIYENSISSSISAAGEVDEYTIALDAGQTATLVGDATTGLQPTVEWLDASGNTLGTATAKAAGADAVLQLAPVTAAGTYTARISGEAGTTGSYALRLVLNAAVEAESYGGAPNDTRAAAQDLDAGFIALGADGARRAAAVGTLGGEDWYRFSLSDGQSASLAASGGGAIDLYDAAGARLAASVVEDGPTAAIHNFVDRTTDGVPGVYYARVAGSGSTEYGLVVTVEVDFDTRLVGSAATPPDMTQSGEVLGNLVGSWWQPQKLLAADAASTDYLGRSVAVSGDIMVVGADSADSGSTTENGAAYVYRYNGVQWVQEQKLLASDAASADFFGTSVAVSGSTIVVGASYADSGGATNNGVAYVYRYDGTQWGQQQKLVAADRASYDFFGCSVAVSGDIMVVGAYGADSGSMTDNGAAYVYHYDGAQWVQRQKFLASDAASADLFGHSVAVSGDTIVVGAYGEDSGGMANNGAAYVYRYDGVQWGQQQKLLASDAASDDYFGRSVAISGDMIIAGAHYEDSGSTLQNGAAYIYRYDGTQWVQQQKLLASDAANDDYFGYSVAVSGDTIVVGAYCEDSGGTADNGAAYVYRYNGGQWVQQQKLLAPDPASTDYFGCSVAASGSTIVVGAYFEDSGNTTNNGAAYAFRLLAQQSYTIAAAEGDTLTIATATPGGGTGEPINTLDPAIALFDPAGTLVAQDDNSAADGRNARLSYTATTAGRYTVRLLGNASNAWGEYLLSVAGATGAGPALGVLSTTPAHQAALAIPPEQITVNFDRPVLMSSLDASDLRIDGNAATAVTIIDADTAMWTLPSGMTEGVHSWSLAAGAVLDVSGNPLAAFTSTFTFDTHGPRVVSSSIAEGASLPIGNLTCMLVFDEDLDASVLDSWDVMCVGALGGRYLPSYFVYKSLTRTLKLGFSNLPEDYYTLTLLSGTERFQDLAGNRIDGQPSFPLPSGDGQAGGDFALHFATDTDPVAMTVPLSAIGPSASGVRSGTITRMLGSPGDVDRVTVPLLAGQRVTVAATPASSLRPTVELLDPQGNIIGAATAASAGQGVTIQTVPLTAAGTYTIRVQGEASTTGSCLLRLIVNAAAEAEAYGGAANDTREAAQDIDACFTTFGIGSARRGAVVGKPGGEDWYRFTLADGQSTSLVASGGVTLDLYDAAGVRLGTSVAEEGPTAAIHNFIDRTTDGVAAVYYVRVTGGGAEEYTLVATRNADFDTRLPGSTASPPDLTQSGAMLGYMQDQWSQQQKLLASDAAASDYFGRSVAVSGNIMVVGASNAGATDSGAAYIYRYDGAQWVQQQKLMAADAANGDAFGFSVAIAGDTIVVGAYCEDSGSTTDNGAAYVYHYDGTQWVQQQKLLASDLASDDYFGWSVAASGDTIVVGAYYEDSGSTTNNGAVYVYHLDGAQWVQQQKLLASDAAGGDFFGRSVAATGDMILVGSNGVDSGGHIDNGAAYVYRYDGAQWVQQQKLLASDANTLDEFGWSLAASGDTIVIGAYNKGSAYAGGSGAAYVYAYDGTHWIERQKLVASDPDSADYFGCSVAASSSAIVVGAYGKDFGSIYACGATYVYRYDGTQWVQHQKLLASDAGGGDYFGFTVGASGDTVVVGAHYDDSGTTINNGAAYVFAPLVGRTYTVNLNAGDAVTLATVTSASGPGEPPETYDPVLELLDPTGVLVARDDNSGPDGRNARLSYTAPTAGRYTVRVIGTSRGHVGELGLSATGQTIATLPLHVASTNPANTAILASAQGGITIDFDRPVLLSSLDAADLVIGGLPATAVTIVDADTARWTLPSGLPHGSHPWTLAAGSVTDLSGNPLAACFGTFNLDFRGPRVTASSLAEGAMVTAGALTCTFTFDEDVKAASLDVSDVTLVGAKSGSRTPTSVTYDSPTRTVQVQFTALPEDLYTLTLGSGTGKFEDGVGNPLDGQPSSPLPSGDGEPGGDFVLRFATDAADPVALPVPLTAAAPDSGLIYSGSIDRVIGSASDIDQATVQLDAGQTATVIVSGGAAFRPWVELVNSQSSVLGRAEAAAAGQSALLQTVSISGAGTYTIRIGGLDQTMGPYTVRLVLNAAAESETYYGPANDSRTTAQDINASFITLGLGTAKRGAVVGKTGTTVTSELLTNGGFETGDLAGWTTAMTGMPLTPWTVATAGDGFFFSSAPLAGSRSALVAFDGEAGTHSTLYQEVAIPSDAISATLTTHHRIVYTNNGQSTLPRQFQIALHDTAGALLATLYTQQIQPGLAFETDLGWQTLSFDLSAYAGRTVRLAFSETIPEGYAGPAMLELDDLRLTVQQPSQPSEDWYRFTLSDGESSSLVATGGVRLDLYDAAGMPLATSVVEEGPLAAIRNFTDRTTDGTATTYYVRATAANVTDYNLVVTRQADIDTRPAGSTASPPQILPATPVLGHLARSEWIQRQKLLASDAASSDHLGRSVAVSGNIMVVGADGEDSESTTDNGAAYVYRYDGTQWVQQQKLLASDAAGSDYFGYSVAASGDTIVIGAYYEDSSTIDNGAAYVFHYDGTQWVQQQKLLASDAADSDYFGWSVAASGDTIVVGAYYEDSGSTLQNGAAYVYRYNGSQWVQQQKLLASDAASSDYFGHSVAISGNTVVVGAEGENSGSTTDNGAAYVFCYNGTQWVQQQKLVASDAASSDNFGYSVAASGDTIVVGAYQENSGSTSDNGAAYIFRFNGTQWVQQQKLLASDAASSDNFGYSVAVSSDTIVVGAYREDSGSTYNNGAAYIFRFNGTQWVQQQKLLASDADSSDNFGYSVAVSGSTIVVGAYGEDSGSTTDNGAAYVFYEPLRSAGTVTLRAGDVLTLATATPGDGSGEPVNALNPVLELFGPAGTLVAQDDNSAADGRNARLAYTATAAGLYTIRIRDVGFSSAGDYVLLASGHTISLSPFAVVSTSVADASQLTTLPSPITIDFNRPVLLSSLDAADLTIAGRPAVAVTVVDADTAAWTLPADIADGLCTWSLAAGSVLDLQGNPLAAFTSAFTLDRRGPRVAESSVAEGAVLAAGNMTCTFTFDEDLKASVLDASDIALVGAVSGSRAPSGFAYTPETRTLQLQFSGLPEDAYTLTLSSGAGQFQDSMGNGLDGQPSMPLPSGDGLPGGDFTVHFSVDTTASSPLLTASAPLGSLIHTGTFSQVVAPAGDSDEVAISLGAGQTVTLVADPASSLWPTVELLDPQGHVLDAATAASPGRDAVLQTVPINVTGTYTVRVRGMASTLGGFTVRLVLNAAVEDEWHDGPANDVLAAAQNLDPSFLALGIGTAQRGAVAGRSDNEDWYRFTLADGESVSLVASGGVAMRLCDDNGTHLATSTAEDGLVAAIRNFADLTTDGIPAIYYVQVVSTGAVEYNLVIIREADFDTRLPGSTTAPPDLTLSGALLSYAQDVWSQSRKLAAADAAGNDYFGTSVAASGDTMVVGAYREDSGTTLDSGAVYVYRRDGSRWVEEQKLLAADAADSDYFGYSVAVDGDTIVVGAYGKDSGATLDKGCVYVYRYDGSGWVQQQKLLAADAAAGDWFGYSVDMNDDRIVVGAYREDSGATLDNGAVYVYRRDGAGWVQEQKLLAADAAGYDCFGYSAAIDGNTIVVGAIQESSGSTVSNGACYVYHYDGAQWVQKQKLLAADAASSDWFGNSLAVSGDTIVVGAYGEDSGGTTDNGAVYLYRYDGTQWFQRQKLLAADARNGDRFGRSVASSADAIVIGAHWADIDVLADAGAAYVYRNDGSQWIPWQKFQADDASVNDYFGSSVAVSGDTVFAGVPGEDSGDKSNNGAVYMFSRTVWDTCTLELNAGDVVTLTTATPASGPREPGNVLDPVIELRDPTGALIARDDNSAPDGRNALLTHTAATGGRYKVRVLGAAQDCAGEYLLSVSGQTGAAVPPHVPSTDPAGGITLNSIGDGITVEFDRPVRLDSLDAGDLTIDGLPANAVRALGGNTVLWTVPEGLPDGTHHWSLAAGAITDLMGNAFPAYASDFTLDSAGPRVIDCSIPERAKLPIGDLTCTLTFNEDLRAVNLDITDATLVGVKSGIRWPATLAYSPESRTVWMQFTALPEDEYTLTLRSTVGGVEDIIGNLLDGQPSWPPPSGDGVSGGDFVVRFTTAVDPTRVNLSADALRGSLIHSGEVGRRVAVDGSLDPTCVDLAAGQTATIVIDPVPGLRPWVELFDSMGSLAGRAESPAAGKAALLQNAPVAQSGIYTIRVGGLDGTSGSCFVRLRLNTEVETEAYTGTANDTLAAAQDIATSFIALAQTGAQRGAVSGHAEGTPQQPSEDWYRFALTDGQVCSLVATGGVTIDLYDVEGTRLAASVMEEGLTTAIHNFADRTTEGGSTTYYVRITSTSTTDYRLIINRDADFDTRPVASTTSPPEILPGGALLGCDFPSSGWRENQKLLPADAIGGDAFGYSVAISGDVMVVGSLGDDSGSSTDNGAVYVYRYNGVEWIENQKLLASDAASGDNFGYSVAIGGDTIVVGAYCEDSGSATDNGAVYVYRYNGVEWIQQQKLLASDAASTDYFGYTVATGGDTIIVGAPYEDSRGMAQNGAAYVFRYNGTQWVESQKLMASDAAADEYFGCDVALDGNTMVVGASLESSGATSNNGAAYVFRYDGAQWVESQKLLASDAASTDFFGCAVVLEGNLMLIGASLEDSGTTSSNGAAYVFRFNGTRWVQEQKLLAADIANSREFGSGVAIMGNTVVVSGWVRYSSSRPANAVAYVYRYDGAQWSQQQELCASSGLGSSYFRCVVATGDDMIVVGASGEDSTNAAGIGAAYVFLGTQTGSAKVALGAGDVLTLVTATPTSGSGGSVSALDPLIRLFDPSGTLVAVDDNSAPDGRNARLTYAATVSGYFTIEVRATGGTSGAFVLSATGQTGNRPPLSVISSDPVNQAIAINPPSQITVGFDRSLLFTSLDAADLTIDGRPATAVTVIDANTAVWTLPAGLDDGLLAWSLNAGSLLDVTGLPLAGHSASITLDTVRPRVLASSIVEHARLPVGGVTCSLTFDEDLKAPVLDASDVMLIDTSARTYTPASFSYPPQTRMLQLQFNSLPADEYTLTLRSGTAHFQDVAGNGLDGQSSWTPASTDLQPGGDFVLHFAVAANPSLLPVTRTEPSGGLVYSGTAGYRIAEAGATASMTIDLEAGQALAVVVDPSVTLRPWVEMLDSAGARVGYAEAAATGKPLLLSMTAVPAAGVYTLRVGGANSTTGECLVRLILGSPAEIEAFGGPANDSRATAQDLGGSFTSLGAGGASRGAVFGNTGVAAELLTNGGFESGDFTGWTTTTRGMPLEPWSVAPAGSGFFFNSAPLTGNYSALVGFDGEAGTQATLYRDVAIPAGVSSATLTTHHRIVYSDSGLGTQSRQFRITLRDTADVLLSTLYTQQIQPGLHFEVDTGWQSLSFDLTAYAGQTIRIRFEEIVPEGYAGPATLELDEVSLTVAQTSEDWYRFMLADGQSASLVAAGGVVLGLYDAQGVLLATSEVEEGRAAIHNFVDSTTDGGPTSYFVRVTAKTATEYQLVVTRGADLDTQAAGSTATPVNITLSQAVVGNLTGVSTLAQQRLAGADAASNDWAGWTVVMDNDVIVMGAPFESSGSTNSNGAAYVYRQIGTEWLQEQKLLASDPGNSDYFGTAIAVDGDTIVIGADGDDIGGMNECGSAYVFRYNGTQWVQTQKLVPSDPASTDWFGTAVAVSGDTIVVAAYQDDSGALSNHGALYIFRYDGAQWVQTQKILASDAASGQYMGRSIAMSGDTIVAGAYGVDAAYVFRRDGETWVQEQKLTASDRVVGDDFGRAARIYGDTIVIGADLADTNGMIDAGAAYVFHRSGTQWTQQQRLVPSDPAAGDRFGFSVAVFGATVVVGAYVKDSGVGADSGAAYAFSYSGSQWFQANKLTAANAAGSDWFGHSVAVSGDAAVVGARNGDSGTVADTGAAYVFSALDLSRQYSIDLAVGDTLTLSTSTPGDAAGEPRNALDPLVELIHPSGAVVASNDNGAPDGRNARLVYKAATAGQYLVRVRQGSDAGGEYLLSASILPVDLPPKAHAGGPYRTGVGAGVRLDAGLSSDPDAALGDTIVNYAWDLNGDGSYDLSGTAAQVDVPWSSLSILGKGTHTLRLRVTDSRGATAIALTTLDILGGDLSCTAGNDRLRIARDSLDAIASVYLGDPWGPAAYNVAISSITRWTITGGEGDDELIVDMTSGSPLPGEGMLFDGGAGSTNRLLFQGLSGDHGVSVTDSQVHISGLPAIDYRQAAFLLDGVNSYTGGTTVLSGTLTVASAGALPPGRSLTIGSGATVVLGGGLPLPAAQATSTVTRIASLPANGSTGVTKETMSQSSRPSTSEATSIRPQALSSLAARVPRSNSVKPALVHDTVLASARLERLAELSWVQAQERFLRRARGVKNHGPLQLAFDQILARFGE